MLGHPIFKVEGAGKHEEQKCMDSIDRIPIGVPGLDEIIGGGLPVPSLTLVSGDVGAGKATFCAQFLCKGAELCETGLCFTTFGEPPESIFKFICTYEFVEKSYLGNRIYYIELGYAIEKDVRAEDILRAIRSEIERFHPRRIVIEHLDVIRDALKEECKLFLLKLSSMVKELKIAAMVTADALPGIPYPPEIAQVGDGIILLQNTEVNRMRRRTIEVLKMRGTTHLLGKHAVDISINGLTVYPGL